MDNGIFEDSIRLNPTFNSTILYCHSNTLDDHVVPTCVSQVKGNAGYRTVTTGYTNSFITDTSQVCVSPYQIRNTVLNNYYPSQGMIYYKRVSGSSYAGMSNLNFQSKVTLKYITEVKPMYMDCEIEIPDVPDMMIPNENFLRYFGNVELPDQRRNTNRSSCLRMGVFLVIRKIIEDYELSSILPKYFGVKDSGLLLDLAAYSITAENNAAQYYPDYVFNHPLFTKQMYIYSDSRISDFFASVTDDQRIGFLNEWNANRDHREKIYIFYDSANKNCQAGELELLETVPMNLAIF